jgi:histidyl-tRNA synthetase
MTKPSLPQGTRDFSAAIVQKRNYIFQTIRSVFELHGFQPLETPAMENLDTLMGKYGEEGDKLIFKILNNGLDNPAKKEMATTAFEKVLAGKNNKDITERALKYDLTIPFARYVAMNHQQLAMPFKRYQMQPVWRADRPQKGRYREFYQCDADVVGSNSLWNEVELIGVYAMVFEQLQLPVEIRINSRKILTALANICGGADQLVHITTAIDKLDKIGLAKVKEELVNRGLSNDQIIMIEKYLQIAGNNEEKIQQLETLLANDTIGKEGIEELEYILENYPVQSTIGSQIIVDQTLARGLNYYTGIIFEIKAIGAQMGSIGGGGRYNDLTSLFGVPNIPGVGISFGVDRIYDVLEELNLFPTSLVAAPDYLFFNLGEAEAKQAYKCVQLLRAKGFSAELYPDTAKLDKQFKYAAKKQIAQVAIIGSKELAEGTCNIKNVNTGEQKTLAVQGLVEFIVSNKA